MGELSATSSTDLAYVAGFFEGEGCVNIGRQGAGFRAQICFANTNRPVLDWIAATVGGRVYEHHSEVRERGIPHVRPFFLLFLNRSEARPLFRQIRPHLIVKADLVDNVLAFWAAKDRGESGQEFYERHRSVLSSRVHLPLPEKEIERAADQLEFAGVTRD
jgi:hypothetical protein